MTGAGVPAGATTPDQKVRMKSAIPLSTMVGTSGSCGWRCGLETASALTFPSRMSGIRIEISGKDIWTCSPSTAVTISGAALIGNMDGLDAGLRLEQFRQQLGLVARAGRGIAQLAGIGLAIGDELFHRI